MKWPVVYLVMCRHAIYLTKIVGSVLSCSYNAFHYNIEIYYIINIFILCHNVLVSKLRAGLVGYCVVISILCAYVQVCA